ncbi:PREDICTED: transmembrane protein 125 [Nanorana parkeri]|uniref:transmembrane protein 125 n=1 Tax=Nanorana parkeri TaxID=125878 RepID=UPI000854B67E|nr:PREDICTED: transmembrane protein 125 [Nanorana parkeri]
MAGVDALRPPRAPPDQERMQTEALEEHTELWWSRQPVKSILCYCLAVLLILACGIGGIVLLSTTTSPSGEWRLAVGATLCILSLFVLLKQLLSSAVQDMQCVTRRNHIDMLRSGGLSDIIVFFVSAIIILVCGVVLLVLSVTGETPGFPPVLVTMHTVGVSLVVMGAIIFVAVLTFSLAVLCRSYVPSRFHPWNMSVFSISGQMNQRQNTASSLANLI